MRILSKIYNLLIKKSKENTHLSTKNIVILISKSQPQIYNIFIEKENFPKTEFLRIIFKKLIKKSKRILIYQQTILVILISKSKPQIHTIIHKNENFPKIELLRIVSKIYNVLIKTFKRILIYQQKF